MDTRQEIEQAIAVLENHRDILEREVIDTAMAALQDKLLALQTTPLADSQIKMAVLFADLSGFTAMSEMMDAEEVRDTINAIWQKLDSVIAAWGGRVDQHIGDGVVALFDVVSNLADCAERAVLAALDMQMELALFNQKTQQASNTGTISQLHADTELRMRIGIHIGHVVFSKVGNSLQYTAVGDTITIANQLEQAAPVGSILISDDLFDHVQQTFDTELLPPVLIDATQEHMPCHQVIRERAHAFQAVEREASPTESRFVGRTHSLEQLQFALETTVESGSTQVITVVGPPGIGKSRLRREFEKYLTIQPTPIHLFKGTPEKGIAAIPYGVIHRAFANFFDIHRRSSPRIARNRLIDGVLSVLSAEESHARERAHFIGQLLGFDMMDSPYLERFKHDARRIREYAFQDIALFFKAITETRPTVMALDEMELADEGSLDLLEYLAETCAERPLLIVCFADTTLLENRSTLPLHHILHPHIYHKIELEPLSVIDSRHLIANRLQNIPRPPQRLVDLLAEAAAGNPFLVTEITELLGEIGVIIKGGQQWRVQMGPLSDLRDKLTLNWLIQKQLERLTPLENEILQKAAVIGETFWEATIIKLLAQENGSATERQIRAAIQNLVQQEFITRHTTSTFAETKEYQFRYPRLRQMVYASLPQAVCRNLHKQCATWLLDQQATHLPNVFAAIAGHLEKTGDVVAAATWYGRAADQSSHNYTPETTIHLFQRALQLLPATDEHTAQYNQLTEGLGQALWQHSRFDAAIEIFSQLRASALAREDMDSAARAFRNLFIIQNFQGKHQSALRIAQEAADTARQTKNPSDLAVALAAQGWAYTYLGNFQQALTFGKEALNVSIKAGAKREMAYCQALIGAIGRKTRQFKRAQNATEKAVNLFREIGDRYWRMLMINNLGQIAWQQRHYDQAEAQFNKSLEMARDMGNSFGALRNLQGLSQIAIQRQAFEQAEQQLQQGLIWAEKSSNVRFKLLIIIDLGRLYLAQQAQAETAVAQAEHLRLARRWLEHGLQLDQNNQHPLLHVILQTEMARLLLAEHQITKALSQIQQAFQQIREKNIEQRGLAGLKAHAIAWRELGNIAAQLSPGNLPVVINGKPYQVADCYQQSLQLLAKQTNNAKIEAAHTLLAWAVYEIRANHQRRGEILWQQAQAVYSQLGLTEEIAKMERFQL